MASKQHILVVGAGLGGLTAALSLLRVGFDATVLEQAPELSEVGAGLQLSANGTRVLHALGLETPLRSIAWQPEGKEIRVWDTGQRWPLFDLGAESVKRYGFPYYMVHRADLHGLLAAEVRRLKPEAIRLSARCVGFDQTGQGVRVRLADGTRIEGCALIGADGVHSTVRQALFGPDQPEFSGCMAWRGIIPVDRLPSDRFRPVGANWIGPGGHVVHYFVRRGEIMNFVGVKERSDWQVESWTAAGTVEECLADFESWHEDVRVLIRNIDVPYKWALMVREPMERWSEGRVGLLGDACHPMLPFLAQGANMAIEDGFQLTTCFQAFEDDVPAALRRFEELRRDRTARAMRGSAANTKLFHSPILADRAHATRFVSENWHPERIRERYDWIYTYDATAPLPRDDDTLTTDAAAE